MTKRILITGGCGFIGVHAAVHYARSGWDVGVFDNLSRAGTELNLAFLQKELPFSFTKGDLRVASDVDGWLRANQGCDAILHLAGQVAVTTSIVNPRLDFEANALGTFNLLEAARKHAPGAKILFASTNKVYGGLEHRPVTLRPEGYDFAEAIPGIGEEEPLDFHSPYGCSKGAADQYIRDYARIYGLHTVVLRQSCIYGTRQFGIEDQGWVAWFTIAAQRGRPITVYGDGHQVRDLLWVEDLLGLYDLCLEKAPPGAVYNAGGGRENRMSVGACLKFLAKRSRGELRYSHADWRAGDQKVFYCDISRAQKGLGWNPRVGVSEGLGKLHDWVQENLSVIDQGLATRGRCL